MMGDIENDVLQPINLAINSFCVQMKKNLQFLENFRNQVDKMEAEFDNTWGSDTNLNNFFFDYEKDVLSDYLLSLNTENKGGIKGLIQQHDVSGLMDTSVVSSLTSAQYMLFENKGKQHLKEELQNLPKQMENPYQILKRFIRWEIMDAEAMIETIETKGLVDKRKNTVCVLKTKH